MQLASNHMCFNMAKKWLTSPKAGLLWKINIFWNLKFQIDTLHGRNPAPPGMYEPLQIMGYLPYQLVQDFFHQQYCPINLCQITSQKMWDLFEHQLERWWIFMFLPCDKLFTIPSWWLNQPIWKICSSNWNISPSFGVNIWKKSLTPTPTDFHFDQSKKDIWAINDLLFVAVYGLFFWFNGSKSPTSWWFQPLWKILVNLDHFPR